MSPLESCSTDGLAYKETCLCCDWCRLEATVCLVVFRCYAGIAKTLPGDAFLSGVAYKARPYRYTLLQNGLDVAGPQWDTQIVRTARTAKSAREEWVLWILR